MDGRLDLRLMRTLDLLLTEQSVSRTADILGQSQPTVSAALKRLREMFGDPILVREGNQLVPTERGSELKGAVERILNDIEMHFGLARPFDPNTDRTFRVLSAACINELIIPRIVHDIAVEAPGAGLSFVSLTGDGEVLGDLSTGKLDLVIANQPYMPPELRATPLMTTEMVCIVREAHPLAGAGQLDIDSYCTQNHITCTPHSLMHYGPIDSQMPQGRRRRIAVSVPDFGLIPSILDETDLVFTTGMALAQHIARHHKVRILAAPNELGPMHFNMLWHERQHRSPAHKWLRNIVKRSAFSVLREATDNQRIITLS